MQFKPWYQSKTVWFNLITGALALLAMPQFISLIPATWLGWIALVNAVGNWILRVYFTDSAISS